MIRVTCPKLAHHERFAQRTIPLFPELREHLLKLFEEAPEGTEHVIVKHRLGAMNLRQQFERILIRTGLTPWPRLFHNLRASRETELIQEYDLDTACKWIGNSSEVATRHYAMSRNLTDDFRRAAGLQAQQKAQQSASARGDQAAPTTLDPKTETPVKSAVDDPRQTHVTADTSSEWAILDSNQ